MQIDLNQSIRRILRRLDILETREGIPDSGWVAFSYASGWSDYSGSWQPGEYRKIGNRVELRGLVKRTSGTGTVIATLPTGYRPGKSTNMNCIQSANTFARSYITSGGAITFIDVTGDFAYVSIDSNFFYID